MNNGPPVPPSRSLGGNGDIESWLGLTESNDFFHENYDNNTDETLNEVPYMQLQHSTTPNNHHMLFKPSLHVYPPNVYQYHQVDNTHSHVPTYDSVSPSPLSPSSTLSPLSTTAAMASPISAVPSPAPLSPQPSPPCMAPVPDLKKVKVEATDNEQWEDYINPNRVYYDLYNNKNDRITSSISLRTRIVADNLEYNPIDRAYVMYRQNQFQLDIDFVGGLTNYSSSANDPYYILQGNNYLQIEGLYFFMYAVKHQRDQPFDPDLVEVTQSCGSRHTKEIQTPGLSNIANGRSVYNKLQFRAATLYNARTGKAAQTQPSQQQQFYRIIIALVAKVGTNLEFIFSRISPCVIVRGQNPGRFKDQITTVPYQAPNVPVVNVVNQPPPLYNNTTTSSSSSSFSAPSTPTSARAKRAVVKVKKEVQKSEKAEKARGRKRARNETVTPIPTPAEMVMEAEEEEREEEEREEEREFEMRETLPAMWTRGSTISSICLAQGKVGINTNSPTEALTVNGNIYCTGTVIKPSDQRIKTNIQPVSTSSQLENIKQLKIYDYELTHGKEPGSTMDKERGLLAQQLQQVLPNATRTLKDVHLADGEVMEELIVVEERALLYESIGATQELSDIVKKDQEKIDSIDKKLGEETEANQKTLSVAGKLLDYILTEKKDTEKKNNDGYCCIMVTHTNKGFYGSIFGLGPAWTLYMLGPFLPIFWLAGALFIFSHNKKRKFAGIAHMATFCLWLFLIILCTEITLPPYIIPAIHIVIGLVGMLGAGLRWNYRRKQRSYRLSLKQKRNLAQVRPEYVLQVKERVGGESTPGSPYMSIPMEDLPALNLATVDQSTNSPSAEDSKSATRSMIEEAVENVTAKSNINNNNKNKYTKIPKSMIDAARAKNAAFAEEEWERNALLV